MQPLRPMISMPIILLALLLLITAPGFLTGWSDLRHAEVALSVKNYSEAVRYSTSAAERLWWREDLWEQAGRAALANGDAPGAVLLLQKTHHLSREGRLALGDAYQLSGELDSALVTYQTMLSEYGASAVLQERIAAIYRSKEDWAAEAATLNVLLTLRPGNAAAHYRLGLLTIISQPDQALPELLLAARQDPAFDPAVQTLRTALNLTSLKEDTARRMMILGRGLGLVQEWPLAAEVFRQAASRYPDQAEAWAWLGEARQHLGEDGLPELQKAMSLDPDSATVQALQGMYWKRHERPDRALANFQKAAALEPSNPAWQAALGETLAQSGDLPPALAVYQRAVELAPQDGLYWRLLATFCVQYNVQVEEIGLPAAEHAVTLGPEDAQSLDILGWVYLSLGRLEEARQSLSHSLEIDSASAATHLRLAMLFLQRGEKTMAHDHLIQAQLLAGDDPLGRQAAQMLAQYFP